MGKTSLSDIVYDTLTILISIADVTTDIIVLISFYNQGRISFFVISLIILSLAQLAYSTLFLFRYDVFDSGTEMIATFFILLQCLCHISEAILVSLDKYGFIK